MFRYRQTQHLQKDLERRLAKLLKPFGVGAPADEQQELHKAGPKPPDSKAPPPAHDRAPEKRADQP